MAIGDASSDVCSQLCAPAGLAVAVPSTNAATAGRGPEREGWEGFPWHYFSGFTINDTSKRSGWTWDHGFDVRDPSGISRWICKPCIRMQRRPVSLAAAGTANQAHHLVKEHAIADPTGKRVAPRAKVSIATQLQLDPRKIEEQALLNKLIRSFNPAHFQQLLVDWIAHDNIPFRKVETEPFRRLIEYLNPAVSQAGCLPTHNTVRKWLVDEFNRHKGIVLELLRGSPGLVHLSFDGWTSRNTKNLLGVIVHFLTSTGKLRQFTIGLHELDGHSGGDMAEQVGQILAEWGLADKIGYFVMDNATNNDSCLENLATEFGFDVKRRRLRCTGHIINLVVRRILFGDDPDLFEAECSHPHELLAEHVLWRKKGPLGKLHNIIHWISRSSRLRKKLRRLQADDAENTGVYEVILDNATRWNSSYAMIERALKLRRYIDMLVLAEVLEWESYTRKFAQQGRQWRRTKPTIIDDYLTAEDWATLVEYHSILQPFKEVTMRLQGNPTNGEFGALWEVLPAMEFLLNHLEEVKDRDDIYPEEHFKVNVSLGWAKLNEYYTLLDETPAYTAAIVLHPGFRWAWIENAWTEKQDWSAMQELG